MSDPFSDPIGFITEYGAAAAPGVAAVGLSLYNWLMMRSGAKLKLDTFVTYGVYAQRGDPPRTYFYFPILVNNEGTKPGMITEIQISCVGSEGEKLLTIDGRVEIPENSNKDPSEYLPADFKEVIPQFPISVPAQEGKMFLLRCSDVYYDVIPVDEELRFRINLRYSKKKTSTIEFPFKMSSVDRNLAIKSIKWFPTYSTPLDPSSDAFLLKKLLKEVGLDHTYARILNEAYFDPAIKFERKKIAILNLEKLEIRHLPEIIGQFTELRELRLKKANLETIPESIGNLSKLNILDLEDNHLTQLPASIGQLSNLKRLIIRKNSLQSLPESIGNLSKLQDLYAQENQLKTIPSSIGSLSKLSRLLVHDNGLKDLPSSLYNLKELTILSISNNELSRISNSIINLLNLEKLSLAKNRELASLPSNIGEMKSLVGLDIKDTAVSSIPESFYNIRNNFFLGYENTKFPEETVQRLKEWEKSLIDKGFSAQVANMTLSI